MTRIETKGSRSEPIQEQPLKQDPNQGLQKGHSTEGKAWGFVVPKPGIIAEVSWVWLCAKHSAVLFA